MARDHKALLGFIAERASMPFAWGSEANDCISYAAGAIKAQTGKNPLRKAPRLRWKTEAGAGRVIGRHGGIEAAIDARMTPVRPTMAKRGDLALVRGVRCVMVVEGDTLVGPGPNGEVRLPRAAMVKAWSAE